MIIEKGCQCFDIGGNRGQTVSRMISRGAGRVITVEPCFENYAVLKSVIADYGGAVIPIHAACGPFCGITTVCYCVSNSGQSTCVPDLWQKAYPDIELATRQHVAQVTIDSLLRMFGEAHYINIAVEGDEQEVILGIGADRPCEYLTFRVYGTMPEEAQLCLRFLKSRGYKKAVFSETDVDYLQEPDTPISEVAEQLRKRHAAGGVGSLSGGRVTVR